MLELGVVLRKSRRPGSLATSTLVASAALARRPAPFESDYRFATTSSPSTCSMRTVAWLAPAYLATLVSASATVK